jgi:hypothetical protein
VMLPAGTCSTRASRRSSSSTIAFLGARARDAGGVARQHGLKATKEMAPADISGALLLSLVLAPAAAIHRWLLLPLFIFGPVQQLAYVWTEWHDPFIGPAISREAGASYGLFADGAMAVAVVAYLLHFCRCR